MTTIKGDFRGAQKDNGKGAVEMLRLAIYSFAFA